MPGVGLGGSATATGGGGTSILNNPWLLGGLIGAGGGAGAVPTNSTTTGSGSSNMSTTQNSDVLNSLLQTINQSQNNTTTQSYSPEGQAFLDNLMSQYSQLANGGTDLSGYRGTGLGNINQAFNNQGTNTNADLAARGLATSPVAGAINANMGAQRVGQQAQFVNSLPLLQNQIKTQNLANASNFMSIIPKTVSSMGTSTGTTNQTGSQTSSMTGTQNTNTNNTQTTKSGGGIGGFLAGLAGTAASLLLKSDKRLKDNIEDDSMSPDMALKAVMKLKPKTFNFKDEGVSEGHHGFVAQDVEKVMPHAVKDIVGIKHIDHAAMMSTVVKAIQHIASIKNESNVNDRKSVGLKKAA